MQCCSAGKKSAPISGDVNYILIPLKATWKWTGDGGGWGLLTNKLVSVPNSNQYFFYPRKTTKQGKGSLRLRPHIPPSRFKIIKHWRCMYLWLYLYTEQHCSMFMNKRALSLYQYCNSYNSCSIVSYIRIKVKKKTNKIQELGALGHPAGT